MSANDSQKGEIDGVRERERYVYVCVFVEGVTMILSADCVLFMFCLFLVF